MDNINRTVVVNDNADSITGEPGSHPIGTAVGGQELLLVALLVQ